MAQSVLIRVSDSVDILSSISRVEHGCSWDSVRDISLRGFCISFVVVSVNSFGIRTEWLHVDNFMLFVLKFFQNWRHSYILSIVNFVFSQILLNQLVFFSSCLRIYLRISRLLWNLGSLNWSSDACKIWEIVQNLFGMLIVNWRSRLRRRHDSIWYWFKQIAKMASKRVKLFFFLFFSELYCLLNNGLLISLCLHWFWFIRYHIFRGIIQFNNCVNTHRLCFLNRLWLRWFRSQWF